MSSIRISKEHSESYDLIVNASSLTKAIDYGMNHLKPGGILSSAMIYLNKENQHTLFSNVCQESHLKNGTGKSNVRYTTDVKLHK